jgi:TolB protein
VRPRGCRQAAAPALGLLLGGLIAACARPGGPAGSPEAPPAAGAPPAAPDLLLEPEKRLARARQLTFEGENAEAYFSMDGRQLIFQSTSGDLQCDQIFTMGVAGDNRRMVSTGKGRTTCAYFFPDGSRIVYASTHLASTDCPSPPPRGAVYVWQVHPGYDIFSASPDGSDLRRLTDAPGYDAEATVAPDGSRIVFTSARDGDLELYSMNLDGSDQRRLTRTLGYDGGAFYSPDSKRICFRASRPASDEARDRYLKLLAEGLVEPSALEIYVMNADGGEARQVTNDGAANFCPFFHPSGEKLIYSSNKGDPRKRNFDLYLLDLVTGAEEQVTFHPDFDGFPMFSPDGKRLVWASNRHNRKPGDTNIFIAEWLD